MGQRIVRIDEDLYNQVVGLAKDKDIAISDALRLMLTEKQQIPGELKKEEVFDLGKLLEREYIKPAFIGDFYCKPCYRENLKTKSWWESKEVELQRDEVGLHFKKFHPEVLEKLNIVVTEK